MYLQTAKYVLKGYRGYITKRKTPPYSLEYFAKMTDLTRKQWAGKKSWTTEELKDIVIKGI